MYLDVVLKIYYILDVIHIDVQIGGSDPFR